MAKIVFEMKEVEKKRLGKFQKSSIYDPILDQFLASGHELVEVSIEGKSGSYISHQLKSRIEKRELDIVASSGGGFAYLEKKPPE